MIDLICAQRTSFPRNSFLGTPFDVLNFRQALEMLDSSGIDEKFRYVVTPNVDHVVRNDRSKHLTQYYDKAWLSLCDSKPIAVLSQAFSLNLPHVTGSDLTAALFNSVIRHLDSIAVIGANEQIVSDLQKAYPKITLRKHIPPMDLASDNEAFQKCVDFAAEGRDRFVFIALGSPLSERIAFEVSRNSGARGIGLCIGASLEFLVGAKKRAPFWMRKVGLEWLHRLASEPRRLWRRYAYALLPMVRLSLEELRIRSRTAG